MLLRDKQAFEDRCQQVIDGALQDFSSRLVYLMRSKVRTSRKECFYADYAELENLLQNKNWKRADDITAQIM